VIFGFDGFWGLDRHGKFRKLQDGGDHSR
jgi:hypothetical protein